MFEKFIGRAENLPQKNKRIIKKPHLAGEILYRIRVE